MKNKLAVHVVLIGLSFVIGCRPQYGYVSIKNLGPNPVTITSNPSAEFPQMPHQIPVNGEQLYQWVPNTDVSTIQAVDMTTFNSDTAPNLGLGTENAPVELEWTGSALLDVTPAPLDMQ